MLNYSVAISYTICREEFFHFSHFPRESKWRFIGRGVSLYHCRLKGM